MRTFDCERLDTTYFRFARTWSKAKIFRTSTSSWAQALSYLVGWVWKTSSLQTNSFVI